MALYLSVALLTNIPKTLVYKCKEDEAHKIALGKLVVVPLKSHLCKGIVIDIIEKLPPHLDDSNVKYIDQIVDLPPFFDQTFFKFYNFVASYYNVSLSTVLKSAFPELGGITIKKRLADEESLRETITQIRRFFPKLTLQELKRLEKIGYIKTETVVTLKKARESAISIIDLTEEKVVTFTEEQRAIKDDVLKSLNSPSRHLLYGKTGTGKTELLLEIAKEVLNLGKGVIYLVPEISLVPYLYKRASCLIKDKPIFIWHSSLNRSYRWQSLLKFSNTPSLLIGTRSTIFLPTFNTGLIIVDEEHDSSYKSEGYFPYNGRDMAILRGKIMSHPVILSSATPSIETFYHHTERDGRLYTLTNRFSPKSLEVSVVNTREEELIHGFFSKTLLDAIENNLKAGEQSLVFINRRGYIPYIYCDSCQKFLECKDCSVPLTWHKKNNLLNCHRCGKSYKPVNCCPYCQSPHLSLFGAGTEKIAELLSRLYPDAKVLKVDRDDVEKVDFFKKHLLGILDGTYNLIVSTQVLAKGHHIPYLTLVGVLLGEQGLSLPDYRASERTFQLLTQVFGRAGRERPGKVIIQTGYPEAPAINFAINDDYEGFYRYELLQRKLAGFPPFTRLLLIKVHATNERKAKETALALFNSIKAIAKDDISVYTPQPAPIYKEEGRFKYHIYVKAKKYLALTRLVKTLKEEFPLSNALKIYYDIDPYNFM